MATQAQTKVSRITRRFKSVSDPAGAAARTSNDVTHISFTTANNRVLEVDLATLFGGSLPPPSVGRAAAAAGISNAIGGAGLADDVATEDPDAVFEAMSERMKALSAGRWTAEHRGGGRPSQVWQAFVDYRTENKADVSEKRLAELRTQYFDNDANFKVLQKDPRFSVYLAQWKAKHAKPDDAVNSKALLD